MQNLIRIIAFGLCAVAAFGQSISPVRNAGGLRLGVADQKAPTVGVILPGSTGDDKSIEVIFPEHVTARLHALTDAEHLYLFSSPNNRPVWQQSGNSIEYDMDLREGIHFLARAVLQEDG